MSIDQCRFRKTFDVLFVSSISPESISQISFSCLNAQQLMSSLHAHAQFGCDVDIIEIDWNFGQIVVLKKEQYIFFGGDILG